MYLRQMSLIVSVLGQYHHQCYMKCIDLQVWHIIREYIYKMAVRLDQNLLPYSKSNVNPFVGKHNENFRFK